MQGAIGASLRLVVCSALYGFAIGSIHSWLYAARNLIKFPLLIATTGAVCAIAYYVVARFVSSSLQFVDVLRLVGQLFHDTALLLAALSPVSFFLAMVMESSRSYDDLGEYPLFQGINVCFIAACGSLALVRQAKTLLLRHSLPRAKSLSLIFAWLALSLFAGGQACWYMRPFFGVAQPGSTVAPFFEGTAPDFRGARSFYEAVFNLVAPPTR